jgi:hypothetical protein
MSYGQDNSGDMGFWERFAQLMLMMSQARAAAAESTVQTNEPVTIRNRVGLPALNALSIAGSFCTAFLGLYLMTWSIAYLLDLDWHPRSWLLAWLGLAITGWLLAAGVKWFFAKKMNRSVQIVKALAAVGISLILFLAVGSLLITAREKFNLKMASMVVGAALILASVGWGYNQLSELVRGYWRRSPYETAMIGIFDRVFERLFGLEDVGQASRDVRTEDPRYLQRKAQYGVVARPVMLNGAPTDEDEPLVDEQLVQIDPEAGNLVWFVRFAARMPSLSISDLTLRPAPLLPFQEDGHDKRLRRDMIRRLLVRGSTEDEATVDGSTERGLGAGGFWELQGQGKSPEWAMERSEAQRKAAEMWDSVYDGELPVPDYWNETNEMKHAA